jgi:hypothetical protein
MRACIYSPISTKENLKMCRQGNNPRPLQRPGVSATPRNTGIRRGMDSRKPVSSRIRQLGQPPELESPSCIGRNPRGAGNPLRCQHRFHGRRRFLRRVAACHGPTRALDDCGHPAADQAQEPRRASPRDRRAPVEIKRKAAAPEVPESLGVGTGLERRLILRKARR